MEIWENRREETIYNARSFRRGSYACKRVYETIDNKRLTRRKGDILKFDSGYYEWNFDDWRDWFLTRAKKKEHWYRDPKIPEYAMSEYALVANRYKVTKTKGRVEFRDYGTAMILLSGPKKTMIRRYFAVAPFTVKSKFPHINKRGFAYVRMKKPFRVINKEWFLYDFNLSEFIFDLLSKYGVCEQSRNMFIQKTQGLMEENK